MQAVAQQHCRATPGVIQQPASLRRAGLEKSMRLALRALQAASHFLATSYTAPWGL